MLFLAIDKIWVIIKLYICSDFLSGHKPKVSEGLILIYHDSYTVFVCCYTLDDLLAHIIYLF
jgi:hypothetical protein